MSKKYPVILALTLAMALSTPAFASSEAWDFATASTSFSNNTWVFGEVFVPTSRITVDYLGYYAANGLGNFGSTHPVGLYDAAGNLLASTVIDTSSSFTTSSGHFAFNLSTPVNLIPGQTYVVEGISNSDPYTWNDVGFTTYAPITILGNNWQVGSSLVFNGTGLINDVTDGYWGPNFGWDPTPTPEPGSLMLLGTGVLGLAGMLRRKLNS